jgi:hypothetical protein
MASWCLLSHVVPSAGTEHAVAPLVAQVRFVVCVMRMSFAASQRGVVVESPWLPFTSECQRVCHPPRLDKQPL